MLGFGFTEPFVYEMGCDLCGSLLSVQFRPVPVSLSGPRTFVLNRESCDVCRQTDGGLFDGEAPPPSGLALLPGRAANILSISSIMFLTVPRMCEAMA